LTAEITPEVLGEEFQSAVNKVYENNSDIDIQNYTEVSAFLINEGADVIRDEHYILAAADLNKTEIIEALADNDYNFRDKEIANATLQSAIEKNDADLVENIIKCGADPNYLNELEDGHEISSFHLAIGTSNSKVVDEMIDGGADVNSRMRLNKDSEIIEVSPLIYSIEMEKPKIAETLIKGDADPEEKIENEYESLIKGTTPLILAVKKNQMNVVKELVGSIILSPKADINVKDSLSNNALMYAIKDKNYEMTEYLIDKGAEVNSINKNEETPLILAIKTKNLDFVDLLIEEGADLHYSDSTNKKPLDYANNLEN
jgi:ankyrin repeat protein